MRKKILWVILASISIGILFLFKNFEPERPLESLSNPKGRTLTESDAKPFQWLSNRETIAQLIRYTADELENQAKIDGMRKEFIALHFLKGNINKHEIRRESLQNMANDPRAIMLAERVFEDFDWVKTKFKDDQAIVRIYAIQLLKTRGQLGEVAALEHAAQTLAKKLASDPDEWQKGREHDLRDLVGAVIQLEGRENILRDVKTFFARVGYLPKLKHVYGSAISSYLYRSGMDEEVDRAFMPFWDEPS